MAETSDGHRAGRRRLGQIDAHLPEPPDLVIPAASQQLLGRASSASVAVCTRELPAAARFGLERADEQRADAAAPGVRMDVAVGVSNAVPKLERPVADDSLLLVDNDPRVALDIEQPPLLLELGRASSRCSRGSPRSRAATTSATAGPSLRVADLSRNELIERLRQQHQIGQLPVGPGAVAGGLVEPVDPDAPQAAARSPGAMSWNRLAATWTWPSRGARVRAKNSSQWRCPGLYEPISCATTTSSKATPIRTCEAAMKSSSVFERIASRQPRRRSSSRELRDLGKRAPGRQRVGQAVLGAGRRAEPPHRLGQHLAVGERRRRAAARPRPRGSASAGRRRAPRRRRGRARRGRLRPSRSASRSSRMSPSAPRRSESTRPPRRPGAGGRRGSPSRTRAATSFGSR